MISNTRLTHSERAAFLQDGYLVVPGELSPTMIAELLEVLDGAQGCNGAGPECQPGRPG